MELIQKHVNKIRVPTCYDNVYKDECVYSFDTPETTTGLYVCLNTFLGFGVDFVGGYHAKTKNNLFLHIRRIKHDKPMVCSVDPMSASSGTDGPEKKVTRLAIGVDGGFECEEAAKDNYIYEMVYHVVIFPEQVLIPYPNDNLPLPIVDVVEAIIASESATKKAEAALMTGTWDGEVRQVSKFAADLEQLPLGKKIPPSGWKCERCDLTTNLWLNLTDGSILCGRKFFDGSGGNDHAVDHYRQTGYPLAVKLGTITSEGKGDVFSYKEDDMVEDPDLTKHLAHFGIKTKQLEKTEKSMVELELDLNQRVGEWNLLCESSSKLEPIAGPGYTGMRNLGNSCYMNVVMQTMFIVPDFVERYVRRANEIFSQYPQNPANDFNVQMAKLGTGLLSGKYSRIPKNSMDAETGTGIAPSMFKAMIGRGHQEFSGKNQQDAQEFFLYLLSVMERNTIHQCNPGDAFRFSVEDRVECVTSKKVKYTYHDEYTLPLQIPMNKTQNKEEVREYEARKKEAESRGMRLKDDEIVRPRISLMDCLHTFCHDEYVDQFYSTALKKLTKAKKSSALASLPDCLMLHLKKFTLREDWTSVKLDVSIDCPDILDMSSLRACDHRKDEELLPDMEDDTVALMPHFDEAVMNELVQQGFPVEACKKALFHTNNSGMEAAMQWIMDHISEPDFSDPFVMPGSSGRATAITVDEQGVSLLMDMGLSRKAAERALKETDNNSERAIDWYFSHQEEADSDESCERGRPKKHKPRDGPGVYKLVAFISHMGTSTQVGHYVCHILKEGRWVIFNDGKVAISQRPPKDLGYLYLYRRQ